MIRPEIIIGRNRKKGERDGMSGKWSLRYKKRGKKGELIFLVNEIKEIKKVRGGGQIGLNTFFFFDVKSIFFNQDVNIYFFNDIN